MHVLGVVLSIMLMTPIPGCSFAGALCMFFDNSLDCILLEGLGLKAGNIF